MATLQQKFTDWQAIESEYRTGKASVLEIADWHHISEGAIRKRAKKHGWVRLNADEPRPEPRQATTLPAVVAAPSVAAPETVDAKMIVGKATTSCCACSMN